MADQIHPLRRWLFDQQRSARKFAAQIGVTHAAISRWLNYHNSPTMDSMVKVRDATAGAVQPNDFAPPPAKAKRRTA